MQQMVDDPLKSSTEVDVGLQVINRAVDGFQYICVD